MSVTPSSPIVGIFTDQSMAERAVEALENAGFEHEQIRYSVPGASGGFFEDLKSLFTGTSTNEGGLVNDLTGMGLSDEEARFYSKEYSSGNIILAVQAPGREQEASSILQQYGAYNSKGLINQAANYGQQPSDSTQQESYANPQLQDDARQTQPQVQTTDQPPFAVVTSERDTEYQSAQPATSAYDSPASDDHPFEDRQQDVITSERDTEYQSAQPVTSVYDSPAYNTQENQVILEGETETQASQANAAVPGYGADYQAAQSTLIAPEGEAVYQVPPTNVDTPRQEAEMQVSQPGNVSTGYADDLAQLMEQIQAVRQQLQEAKARLQAEKEREAQLQAAREREQQLQAARQQLQEMQSELQATLAELQETQARHTQYE